MYYGVRVRRSTAGTEQNSQEDGSRASSAARHPSAREEKCSCRRKGCVGLASLIGEARRLTQSGRVLTALEMGRGTY